MKTVKYSIIILAVIFLFSSCEKEIEVNLPSAPQEFVIEGYINQLDPLYNYVVISKTVDFFNPDLSVLGVKGAIVYITEGTLNGKDTIWDVANKKHLIEFPADSLRGIYFDPTFSLGKEGNVYKLEIAVQDRFIFGVTTIPKRVPLDSITQLIKVNPDNNKDTGRFMTLHFMEPAEKGNNYKVLYRVGADTTFGWGAITDGNSVFDDEIVNGIYRHFTYGRNFNYYDTINYYFCSIDRSSYNFWQSYEQARDNGGPFATPVQVKSNVKGAIGSFTGLAVTRKTLIIRPE